MAEQGLIDQVPTTEQVIAITFDDGPNPLYTMELLGIFAKAEGKATFFMIGEQMKVCPEVVKKVYEQGHEIGNHTYSHADLTGLSTAECLDEIEKNEQLIEDLIGKKPAVFRPPFLAYNQDTVSIMEEKGYPMIGALNLEARDWDHPGAEHILSASQKCVKNGAILIFHDGYGDRSQTIEAVRRLVPELKSQGYRLVTVSELLRLSGVSSLTGNAL